jgi:RNA polymerase sigma factor (sigma-70 family)
LGPTPLACNEIDDIVAEAWLVTLPRLGDLVQSGGRYTPRILAFLSTTITHVVNRRLDAMIRRQSTGTGSQSAAGSPTDLAADITGVVTQAARAELSKIIEVTLEKLPERDRKVVILRGIEGLTNQEAARELEEEPNTVSHRYRRALKKLRDALPSSVFDKLAD